MTGPVRWTKEEEAILTGGSDAPRCVAMVMEKLPGRSRRAIEKRCEILGVRMGLPGTPVTKYLALQINLTREEYDGLGVICKRIQMKKATFIRWMIQQLMLENGEQDAEHQLAEHDNSGSDDSGDLHGSLHVGVNSGTVTP